MVEGHRHLGGWLGPLRRHHRGGDHDLLVLPEMGPRIARRPRFARSIATYRPGDRTVGQLLQPGAVRHSDRSPVGTRDRPGEPARRLSRRSHLPPHLPVRITLEPGAGRFHPLARSAIARAAGSTDRRLSGWIRAHPLLAGVDPY